MVKVDGFLYQDAPRIYVANIPGHWILKHSRTSWRIDNPVEGFQRMVNEKRARNIASSVLDTGRCFPNAIVISSKEDPITKVGEGELAIKDGSEFLVIDGQHRLWAQNFSNFEANFVCLIHVSLSEVEMATLFIEINNTQKRVPPSLRWDLVRLIQKDEDMPERRAADLVYELVMEEKTSPLYQKVDLTGEIPQMTLTQASIAPEICNLLKQKGYFRDLETFEEQKNLLLSYFTALKQWDEKGWHNAKSLFAQNRGLRAAIKILNKIVEQIKDKNAIYDPSVFEKFLSKIDKNEFNKDKIKALQGTAGINAIKETLIKQIWG